MVGQASIKAGRKPILNETLENELVWYIKERLLAGSQRLGLVYSSSFSHKIESIGAEQGEDRTDQPIAVIQSY